MNRRRVKRVWGGFMAVRSNVSSKSSREPCIQGKLHDGGGRGSSIRKTKKSVTAIVLFMVVVAVTGISRAADGDSGTVRSSFHTRVTKTRSKGKAETAHAKAADAESSLRAQIMARLPALLPPGVRVKSVQLQCEIKGDETLKSVAPGITRLSSPNFLVELDAKGVHKLCPASIQAERQVVYAVRNVAIGEAVSPKDFALRWVDAFFGAPGALDQIPDLRGAVAAIPIQANTPIYATALRRPAAVRPGDMVTVYVKNGPVRVKALLESRSTASVGDTAIVVNPQTGVPVTVKVTGIRTAELVMQ